MLSAGQVFSGATFAQVKVAPPVAAVPAPPRGLRLQLQVAQPHYAVGEPIAVRMLYTYAGDETLRVSGVDFARAGRVSDCSFRAVDASGKAVRDPAAQLIGSDFGGSVYSVNLTKAQSFERLVIINQWLALDKPGRYVVTAHSKVVRSGDSQSSPAIALDSEPLIIEITAPDEARRVSRLQRADLVLQVEDRELDQNNRQMRVDAVTDLRFMLDPRAIPLLVRALHDKWRNVQFEARLGLLAFEDPTPVKAGLLRAIEDDSVPYSAGAKDFILTVLREMDRRQADKAAGLAEVPLSRDYAKLLDDKLRRQLSTLTPPAMARTVLEAMQEHQLDRVSAENWQLVLGHAASLPPRSQSDASELFGQLIRIDRGLDNGRARLDDTTLRLLQTTMSAVARDETVQGSLRSACIVGLAQIGDHSFRDLLVQEFMALQPKLWSPTEWGHPWRAAQKALGDYKAKEIAQQLLAHLNAPSFRAGGYYQSRSIVLRLSDFGPALSVEELRGALQRTLEVVPDGAQQMMQALALKAPDAAVPFIRALAPANAGKEFDPLRFHAISYVLARLTTPAARTLMDELLRSPQESDRSAIVHGFAMSAQEARERRSGSTSMSRLAPREELAATYVPELLRLFQEDPAPRIRASAFYALGQITGIPKGVSSSDKNADDKRYLNQWREWWQQNRKTR
jgi:HEAT repeat protein